MTSLVSNQNWGYFPQLDHLKSTIGLILVRMPIILVIILNFSSVSSFLPVLVARLVFLPFLFFCVAVQPTSSVNTTSLTCFIRN